MTETRIEQTTPATGTPAPDVTSNLPAPIVGQNVVKGVATLVGIAGVLMGTLPPHTIAWKVCAGVVALGAFFGIVSPGVRKP
jgi:hypothetical protein